MSQFLFLFISTLGLLAALGTVLARNLVRAALHLVAFFFIIACQFLLLEAEFLAAIQVLVYIGAVAILMMFGIMLTRNVQGDETTSVPSGWKVPGVLVTLALFGVLAAGIGNQKGWSGVRSREPAVIRKGQPESPRTAAINNMAPAVGREMMTRFVVPFELAGLLLTAALVGAIALAYREGDEETPRRGPAATRAPGATTEPNGNGHVEPARAGRNDQAYTNSPSP